MLLLSEQLSVFYLHQFVCLANCSIERVVKYTTLPPWLLSCCGLLEGLHKFLLTSRIPHFINHL